MPVAEPSDPYAVLGLTPSATPEQVRRAYRALLRRHHPDARDANAGSDPAGDGVPPEDALQRAIAAYAVLGDSKLRADQDRRRESRQGRPITVRRTGPPPPESDVVQVGQPAIRVGPVRWHRSSR